MKMFLTEHWSDRRSVLENICYIESRIFLQPLLQMTDRMTMAHGIEGRCPFLDHRIVEFAFSLDDSLRYRDGSGKWLVHQDLATARARHRRRSHAAGRQP